jgi:hypothetical protein
METLTFTVTGANPQTYTTSVQINVNPSTGLGSGTATFLYIGNNAGNDTVVATLTSQNGAEGSPFTSNQAGLAFQAVSGPIAVSPITLQIWPNQGDASSNGYFQNPNGTPPSQTLTVNSLMLDPYPESWLPGYSNLYGSGNGAAIYPPVVPIVTSQGTWSGSNTVLSIVTSFSNGRAQMDSTGSFVVSAAGTYTFYADSADGTFLGIGGGVTYGPIYAFPPGSGGVTPLLGLPIVMCTNMSGSNQSSISQSITFPAPGIYQFEATNAKAAGSNYYCNYIYSSGMFNPVNIIGLPSGTPASGLMQLTPTGGNSNIYLQGQQGGLTLNINGIQYPTANYMPILEGTIGGVFIFNSPTSNVFTVQTFNGLYLADYSPIFTITGDNGAWQGLIGIAGDSTTYAPNTVYRLETTSSTAIYPAGVQLTNLTVTLPDIAWYNPGLNYGSVPTGGEDEFQVSSSGGGGVFNIPIYYLLNPNFTPSGTATAFSLSPTSIPGDGSTQNFTVTLARPLPPLQNGTLPNVFWAGVTPSAVSAFTPQINSSNGFLYGWVFSAAFPIQSSTVVATMTIQFITPTITYAGQWSFITTNNFIYAGGSPSAQITITASQAQPPYNAGFSEIDPTSFYQPVSYIGSFGPATIFETSFFSYVANCNGYSVYAYPVVNGVAGAAIYLGGGVDQLFLAPQSNGQFLYYTQANVSIAPRYPTDFAQLTPQGIIILSQWQFGYTASFSDGQSISYIDPGVYYAFVE